LTKAGKTAKNWNKAILHIEVETGMNRTGFEKNRNEQSRRFPKKKEKNMSFLKDFAPIMPVLKA
jgi:alanine racemase